MRVFCAVVGLIWIGVSVWGAGPTAEQRPDPVADLKQLVERSTGSDPLECGRHLLVQVENRWVAADEAALQKSVECGLAAASGRRAFWTFKQGQGIRLLGRVRNPWHWRRSHVPVHL